MKSCDITDFIQSLISQTNPDGTRKFSDEQVMGKLKKAYKSGLISRAQIISATGKPDIFITESEFIELENMSNEVANSKQPVIETLGVERTKRFFELANKAKNSVSTSSEGRLSKSRLTTVLDNLREVDPENNTDILTLLDEASERAERNGNKERAAKIRELKTSFQKMADLSSRLKIDWNAIVKTNKQIDKLMAEYALVKSLLDIGDRETASQRKTIADKILGIIAAQKKIIDGIETPTPEDLDKIAKLDVEKNNLITQMDQLTSKQFAKNKKKLEKRLKTLQHEIRRLQDNTPNTFLSKVLVTVSGLDPNFIITNLRDLKERQLKTEDDIKLVDAIIEKYPEDKEFSLAEVQGLIGDDITTTKAIKNLFYEPDVDADGKEKLDSANRPMLKRKDKIKMDDFNKIISYWKQFKRKKAYDSTVSTLESNAIRNALLAGDTKLVNEVDATDPLPIARDAKTRLTTKVGKQYDPRKIEDRVSLISDLHSALKRLTYVSSLSNSSGMISQGMLVGILGSNAQSLIHKFDDSVADDAELDNPYIPEGETTNEGRRNVLRANLLNLGYTQDEINAMPEFSQESHLDDFTKVVSFDLEWEPNTDNIIGISIIEFTDGDPTPKNIRVIYSKDGKDKYLNKEDASEALQLLQNYQNNGYKVTGHNILGEDSDIQKLVSMSEQTKLGMGIALRSLDTMLLAYRNGSSTSFTRQFGPSLNNLAQALKVGSKTAGVTGLSAHDIWKSGDYKTFEEYAIGDAILAGRILQEMVKNKGKTIEVNNARNQPQSITLHDIVPMWYDTSKPEPGRNQRYTGINALYDIIAFNNLKELNGPTLHDNLLYDISKVRNTIVNIILVMMKSNNQEDLDSLLSAINSTQGDAIQHMDLVLSISRTNQEAYLPVLREIREANGNQFLSSADREDSGDLVYVFCDNGFQYETQTIEEVFKTLGSSSRAHRIITRFASLIGFRKINTGENIKAYTKELFEFSAKKFNGKEVTIQDFGNANFDYVPAQQLGRGFAQIMVGNVEEGLTLSQSPKTPVEEIDKRREEAQLNNEEIEFEDETNLVEKREYLPITKQNVSFFAPLSMYEQERAYNDFALRQRFHHILNRDITSEDIKNFEKWVGENKIVDYKNTIKAVQLLLKHVEENTIKTEDDIKNILDKYNVKVTSDFDPKSTILNTTLSTKDKIKYLKKEVSKAQKTLADYIQNLDRSRLELGRVQRYNLLNIVNNRDIYNRIPTLEEVKEMSLEVALDLPQMVATWVHDSFNSKPDEPRFLNEKAYWEMPELSSGGPTGAALLSGIYPQISWLMSHPEISGDPELFKNLVKKSLENAIDLFSKGVGYSRNSYWDDNMSGLHHILALQWSYFPDQFHAEEGGLLNILNNIKTGNVGRGNLTDYYNTTADQFNIALEKLRNDAIIRGGSDPTKNPDLEQINRIQSALYGNSESREFFKGAVIPVLYSAGYPGVLKGLQDKRSKITDNAINKLKDEDLQFIASKLIITGAVVQGRLIDDILGMKAELSQKLIQVFLKGTERLTSDMKKQWMQILAVDKELANNFISEDAARKGILQRLRYIAELTLPAYLENATQFEKEKWIGERVKLLEKKWQTRIDNAIKIIKKAGGKIEVGSNNERDLHVALAGDESAFKNQMTLMAINQMQNSGIKLNTSDRDILEASVRTGRYIAPEDLMFGNHVVYTTVGLGTSSGRAQYVGNNLTNLHGSRLSKGNRIVYNEDGSINWDETVQNSAWSLQGNSLTGKSRSEAKQEIDKLAVKHYMLMTATDYPPTPIGYNQNDESRENFFRTWSQRTKREREYEYIDRLNDREKLKQLYETRDPTNPLTDSQIDASIESNSTPINKRIGTRILAGAMVSTNDETIMPVTDAKGLAAFRPRLADHAFEDRIIHGLYTIYQGTQALQNGVGNIRNQLQKMESENITPESILDMKNSRATAYDPNELGVYFPEVESSLVESMFGYQPTFSQKVNQLKFVLDTFAKQHGLEELVNQKEYARLYQIYKIRQSLKKFALLLSQGNISEWEMRFLHRHLVQQVFRLTKPQRDAVNSKRNILDFSKSIGIDPTLFRDEMGNNLQWIDALGVLADLGIEELGTLQFGMSPVEMLTTSNKEAANILKQGETIVTPNVVQGEDVAHIIQGIWADIRVQQKATEYAEHLVATGKLKDYQKDSTGKYILLSSVPKEIQKEILNRVLNDEDLIMAVAENLGIHVTFQIMAGENKIRFQNSKFHSKSSGFFVVGRRGLGDPEVNRTVTGERDIKFYLTPEAVKRILIAAKNAGFFSRLETAVQVNKYIGNSTTVQQLRQQRYGEYLDRHLHEIAEETEVLHALEEGKLSRLRTDRLKDELGIELNLYDAESYFTSEDSFTQLTPFKNALTLDIRVAMERAKQYPSLQSYYESLVRLMTEEKNQKYFLQISFIQFLRNNVSKSLSNDQLRILLDEHFGSKLTDAEFDDVMTKADQVTRLLDIINHTPFKGKNKYLTMAIKHREIMTIDPGVLNVEQDTREFMAEFGIPAEDVKLAAQAVIQAHHLMEPTTGRVETYSTIPSSDLVVIASDPTEFARVFPEGNHINLQLSKLKTDGVIDDETEIFYRLLIGKVLKHNPNLARYLSIEAVDLGNYRAAEAIKDGDKFVININPTIVKNMGRIDATRVFAHEVAHIARLAFIADNSMEWRRLESLFRSKKGKQSISTMLLIMNNGKKYDGFERDVQYYTDNPEEFIAQWGSWILMEKVFNNADVMKRIQTMDRGAVFATETYKTAFHRMRNEVLNLVAGLSEVDDVVLNEVIDITEGMFGFTASTEREIQVRNENKKLGMLNSFDETLSNRNGEVDRLALLTKESRTRTLTTAEMTEKTSLENKYVASPLHSMDIVRLQELRAKREAAQGTSLTTPASRTKPGKFIKTVHELDEDEREEIANTVIAETLKRGGKLANNTGTIGGLTRNTAEAMFGKRFVNQALWARIYLGTGGLTQARRTYGNDNKICAALMHIIGESFSNSENQYQMDTGTRSIRENRVYAQQWVERVSYEIGQLRMMTDDDEFKALLQYAHERARGMPSTLTLTISAEKIDQANEVAKTILRNSIEMRNYIYGGMANLFEEIPIQLNKTLLGARLINVNPTKQAEFNANKQELIEEVGNEIVDVVKSGKMNSALFYVSGLGPRIKKQYSYNNNGMIDIEFINELKRVQNMNPGTFALIMEIAVRELANNENLSEVDARNKLARATSDPSFLVNLSPQLHSLLHSSTLLFYELVNQQKSLFDLEIAIKKLGITRRITNIDTKIISDVFNEMNTAITSKDPIRNMSHLFVENSTTFPAGVSDIKRKSTIILEAQNQQTLKGIMAGLLLSEMGEQPDYLRKNEILTSRNWLENPKLAKFVSTRSDIALTDIERSKGFRAASRIAIQDITGITGYDIYDLITIFRSLSGKISPDNNTNLELDENLKVIEQKLNIEQGLSARGLSDEDDVYTNFFLKYGPEITRLAYGSNLNTASLIMEGALGAFITLRYGGNPVVFFKDLFGSVFSQAGTLFQNGDRYNPRGLAINMMRGLEHSTRNARDIWTHTTDLVTDSPTLWEKYKNTMSRVNSAIFNGVAESLTNQAQQILIEHLNNGNLVKIRNMLRTELINNMDDLKAAMNKHNIRGILPHLVFELKQSGIFEENTIEAYQYMLTNIKSKNLNNGILDFVAANKWIEEQRWTPTNVSKFGFDKATAYRTVATMYNATKNFRNIVLVENNPWDSNTHTGGLRFLTSFYRQYPNLFFSQKVMRLANKMDTGTLAASLIGTLILDLLYNAFLLVALGALPLTALIPFHKDFIFNKDPLVAARLIVGRNPIFGVTGNILAGAVMTGYYNYADLKNTYNRRNRYDDIRRAIGKGMDQTELSLVPTQAAETLIKDPMTMILTGLIAGGNINEQELWNVKNAAINTGLRFVPLFGELPVRVAANKLLLGEKPRRSQSPITGYNVQPTEPTTKPEYQRKPLGTKNEDWSTATEPIKAPRGL